MEKMEINLDEILGLNPELYDLKLPDADLVEWYRDYEERHIYINFDITEDLISVSRQIMRYNFCDRNIDVKDRKPIYLYIYSYGGDLSAVYSTIAICEASQTPIVTVNMGVCMSAGMLLLLAGHKRYCLRRSQALAHQGSGGMQGTFEQMEESQKSYKKMIDEMRDYILAKTKIDIKLFNKNKSKDWYISDELQVEYGIVDKIVDNIYEIV